MSSAAPPMPKPLEKLVAPVIPPMESLLRDWEWNWTKACLSALILWFLAIGTIGVIPSWWLYYATSTLQWTGPPASSFWLKQARDVIAVILFSIPTGLFIVVPFILQNWRRRLRGTGGDSRPSGGYR
jgi:hypothetical protein